MFHLDHPCIYTILVACWFQLYDYGMVSIYCRVAQAAFADLNPDSTRETLALFADDRVREMAFENRRQRVAMSG